MMDKLPFFVRNAIGNIPKDWDIKLISAIIYFQEGPGIRKWQFAENGIPFLNIRCIKDNGKIDHDNLQYIKEDEVEDRYEHFLLNDGDTVVSSSGTLGKMAIIQEDDLPLMLNTSVIRFRSKDDTLSDKFMRYYLKSKAFMLQFQFMSQGSAQVNVGPTHLKQMYIVLPSLPEQKKIAAILSSVDKAIEKTDEIIEETKELKKGLMQQLLTKGIGHSEFKEVRIGTKKIKIPKSWGIESFGKIYKKRTEKVKSDIDHYYVGLEHMETGKIVLIGYGTNGNSRSSNRFFRKGDILYGKLRPYLRKAVVSDIEGICSTDIIPIYSTTESTNNYLIYLIHSKTFVDFAVSTMEGTNLPRTSWKVIKNLNIPVPPLQEQKKIAVILSSVDDKIQKEQEYKNELIQLKKGLMQKLLTGEVRVKIDEEVMA